MIVDIHSALIYAQSRANTTDEPVTIYYIPTFNIWAFGRIGSHNAIQHLYPTAKVIRVITMSPISWQVDTEEEV